MPTRKPHGGKTSTRVLGFARISRDTEASTSLSKQKTAIENFCAAMGWHLVHVAESASVSGSTAPRDHESLSPWLTETPPEPWDVLLSNTLDRVSRSTRDTLDLVEWLDDRGKTLRTIQDGVNSSSGTGKLMITILAAVAQAERTFTMERLAATRVHLRRGGWHQQGTAPYGYRTEQVERDDQPGKKGWRWVIDDDAQKVIHRIVRRAIDGVSVSAICDELNREAIPPPSRGGRRSDRWHPASLHRILKGEQLLGHGYHDGKVVHEHGRPVAFGPPLIDRGTYDRLQLALSGHGKPHAKNHARSLLYGMITCAECGTPMVGSGQGVRESYVCRNRACRNGAILRRIVREELDGYLTAAMADLLFIPGRWTVTENISGLQSELSELIAASTRLLEDRQAGMYDDPSLLEIFRREQAANTARMADIRRLLEDTPAEGRRVFEAEGSPTRWLDAWQEAEANAATVEATDEQRELLAIARVEVVVTPPVPGGSPADRVRVVPPYWEFDLNRDDVQISWEEGDPLYGVAIHPGPLSARGAVGHDMNQARVVRWQEADGEDIRMDVSIQRFQELPRWANRNPGLWKRLEEATPEDPGYDELMREVLASGFPVGEE